MKIKASAVVLTCVFTQGCASNGFPWKQQEIEINRPHYIVVESNDDESKKEAGYSWFEYVRFVDDKKEPSIAKVNSSIKGLVVSANYNQSINKQGLEGENVNGERGSSSKWLFNAKGRYTVQYTSSPNREAVEKLAHSVQNKTNSNAHVLTVSHGGERYYIVLSGEYQTYSDAERNAVMGDVWVRKISTLRKNRCDSSESLKEFGVDVSEDCK